MATGSIEVRLLDGGSVTSGDTEVPLAPLQRRLLAVLADGPHAGLSTAQLVDRLWDDGPPVSAAASVRNSVSRIRAALGADAVEDGAAGYRLGPRVGTDLDRLCRLSADPDATDNDLADALAALDRTATAAPLVARAARLRDVFIDRRCELALHGSSSTEAELDAWATDRPDRELRWSALTATLVRQGRRREAVEAVGAGTAGFGGVRSRARVPAPWAGTGGARCRGADVDSRPGGRSALPASPGRRPCRVRRLAPDRS